MTVQELSNKLGLKVLTKNADTNKKVTGGFCSDMLSYVMGKSAEGQAWITIQGHNNVVAVASLKELACIILADGIMPDDTTIENADDQDVVILAAMDKTFELAGKMGKLL